MIFRSMTKHCLQKRVRRNFWFTSQNSISHEHWGAAQLKDTVTDYHRSNVIKLESQECWKSGSAYPRVIHDSQRQIMELTFVDREEIYQLIFQKIPSIHVTEGNQPSLHHLWNFYNVSVSNPSKKLFWRRWNSQTFISIIFRVDRRNI